jgi:hypothetical protein
MAARVRRFITWYGPLATTGSGLLATRNAIATRLVVAASTVANPTTDTSTFLKGNTMKFFATAAISAGALTSAALGLAAAANAAPTGPTTADQTVSQLQASGYQVILNKVGTAPLNQCTVGAVRPGQTYSRTDSGAPGAQDDLVTTVTAMTVYVDVNC